MSKEWITVKECIGLPGFPTSSPAVRSRLDDLSLNKPELKRKRTGGKAYEYHVSILPQYAQQFFSDGEKVTIPNTQKDNDKNEYINNNNELSEVWTVIFKLLTPKQQKDSIELFKNHGLSALLPTIVGTSTQQAKQEPTETAEEPTYSREVMNTAMMLHDLPDEKRREILLKHGLEERDGAVALISPQEIKNKAG